MSLFYNSASNRAKNIGGAILSGGNNNVVSQNYLGFTNINTSANVSNRPYAPVPVLGTTVTTALGGGEFVFAYNNPKVLIKTWTSAINNGSDDHELGTSGTVDTSLITNIHSRTSNINRLDTTAIRNNQYDAYTGKFNEGYPTVSQDDFGNDVAASPTRANPGLLSFTLGKNVNTQQYISKTG